MRALCLLAVVAGCYSSPDPELGSWDRFITGGAYVAPGTLDRLTFTLRGGVTRERDGARVVGRWTDDGFHNVTLAFPGDVTTWGVLRVGCITTPNATCLRCDGRGASVGLTDWYRPDYPLPDAGLY